jgi:hypothetical protein
VADVAFRCSECSSTMHARTAEASYADKAWWGFGFGFGVGFGLGLGLGFGLRP